MTLWSVRGGNIVKMTTITLDFKVKDKDVRMLNVYDTMMICFSVRSESGGVKEIHVYSLKNDTWSWSHVLANVGLASSG